MTEMGSRHVMVDLAARLSEYAHMYQTRMDGRTRYFEHPKAVALSFNNGEPFTEEKGYLMAIAYLHDVVEDTFVTIETIQNLFPSPVSEGVKEMTHEKGYSYWDYIQSVKKHRLARLVKIADIEHNLATLPEGHGLADRYHKALEILKI